ncbi:Low-affinity potassium transport protein [Lachnellula suecica]|uniref:Low-affinity potassium transport protein n=1 Tax=Lachnellula suecica TaxID=602035 RepID=A0A8T9BYP7_9HELO|nr:Low-affinity potassium transport protein [Lachnellula suecica]
MVVSAISLTGMNTVNVSDLNTGQQVQIYFLMVLGSPILVSICVIYIRKRDFYHKFPDTDNSQRVPRTGIRQITASNHGIANRRASKGHGCGLRSLLSIFKSFLETSHQSRGGTGEKEKIPSDEYEALRLLLSIIPLYLVLFQATGALILALYMSFARPDASLSNGINPVWLGIFLSTSSFNNVGLSLLDQSMMSFQTSYLTLITSSILVLIGNTGFPIFLRLLLWLALKVLPESQYCEECKRALIFILRYPRRVYTHVFPYHYTWILFGLLLFINTSEWIALEILNKDNPILTALPLNIRWLDGFYQTAMTRSAGFAVFSISSLRIGIQALYLAMMFVSAYPIIMIMRTSNVYEERSLGIYSHELSADAESTPGHDLESKRLQLQNPETIVYSIQKEIQKQLSHDVWFPITAAIIILWIETGSYDRDPITFSVFNIFFETVSAYACVGLSTGLQDQPYSLSGEFHSASKLILCAAMLRGRHRGLPVAIDRAIQLPHNALGEMQVQLDVVDGEVAGGETAIGADTEAGEGATPSSREGKRE